MMLPSDIFLLADPELKKWVQAYCKDEDLFFEHFSSAFSKLLELGVPFADTNPETIAPVEAADEVKELTRMGV
jgi:cytochrome c peroxidase